jgi:hypothetical protein
MPKKIKKEMMNVEGEMCFWVNNGPVLKNMNELYDALKNMDQNIFDYHVNSEKNDFAKWVDEALHDADLAKKLLKCTDPASMVKVIEAHIKKNY